MSDVMSELEAIALARPTDLLKWEDGKLELADDLTGSSAAAIASIERSNAGVKVRFHDKLKAIEMLLLHGAAGGDRRNNLLEAILRATAGELTAEKKGGEDENGIFITEGS